MAFGVFIHRTDSIYEDVPSEQYQFPKQYLTRAKQCVGSWIVYLEPSKVRETKGYFAVAKVQEIIPDPQNNDLYLAIIEKGSYLDFGDPVPFNENGLIVEQGLLNDSGRLSGRAQAAVRILSTDDFNRILDRALGRETPLLPRDGDIEKVAGLAEPQTTYEAPPPRQRLDQITNRVVRDRNFRKTVLRAYKERCAITGIRLINGGGRAEVEAAHIRAVEHDGPDIVSNGIALSGTAHWMFDRGLVGIGDDYEILVSRQANDPDTIHSMINQSGKLIIPNRLAERPRREFVEWHRINCFKN